MFLGPISLFLASKKALWDRDGQLHEPGILTQTVKQKENSYEKNIV
jgi:hypothetical protein